MPRITVDFSDVQDFEAVPKGEYDAVIVKAEYREPTEDGKFPYINLEMDVQQPAEFKGRKLWSILSLAPKALWRTKQTMENLEVYEEELDIDVEEGENDVLMVTSPELVGLPVTCAVSQREYEGRTQNQVDSITGTGGAPTRARGRVPAKASGPAAKKRATATGQKKFK